MLPTYQLFIGGEWRDPSGGETMPAVNPNDQSVWANIPIATASDVDAAVGAARTCFDDSWRHSTGLERSRLMHRLADLIDDNAEDLAQKETRDNGKVIRETRAQMGYAARVYRFFAGYADKVWGNYIPLDQRGVMDVAIREPLGVIAAITAWNSPITLLANKLAAALAAGNCVVVKPSEHASATTLEFAALMEKAGFPAGVFNVVTGGPDVGSALINDHRIDKISFTGSAAVGREIAASAGRNLRPVTLELGGKSPNIIFEDANVDAAIVGALAGIFGATGQTCIAGSRLLVQRSIYDKVVSSLAERAENIVMGDPSDPTTEMGTAANKPQFDRILAFIDSAKTEGARLVTGGERAIGPGLDMGFFIQPTIFADVKNDMKLARDEIFGPVLGVIPFDDEAEAVSIANDTAYGLASGIWTQDISLAMRMMHAVRSGVVWINTYRALAAQGPFGGMKDSGFGRERGEQGLLEFTTTKNVMIDFSGDVRDPFAMKL